MPRYTPVYVHPPLRPNSTPPSKGDTIFLIVCLVIFAVFCLIILVLWIIDMRNERKQKPQKNL